MSLHALLETSCQLQDCALVFLRICIGIIFIRHGYSTIISGKPEWIWLGKQMQNLGITWLPLFWGLAATCAKFSGGILLILGLATRVAASFMAFTMFVAMMYHIKNNDSWGYISHPLAMMFVFIGFIIAGSGSYSLDTYLLKYVIK